MLNVKVKYIVQFVHIERLQMVDWCLSANFAPPCFLKTADGLLFELNYYSQLYL